MNHSFLRWSSSALILACCLTACGDDEIPGVGGSGGATTSTTGMGGAGGTTSVTTGTGGAGGGTTTGGGMGGGGSGGGTGGGTTGTGGMGAGGMNTGGMNTGGMGAGGMNTGGMNTGGVGAGTGGMGTGGIGAGTGGMNTGGMNTGGMGTGGVGSGTGGMGAGGGGSAAPAELKASILVGDVDLMWTKAAPESGHTYSKVVRTLNAPPTGPNDPAATVIYTGPAATTVDDLRKLLPSTPASPRTYHYAVYGCTPALACETTGASTTLTPTIAECLEGGGYTVFWRHASATVCADATNLGTAASTSSPDWWKSCDDTCPVGQPPAATARQLNSTGVTEAITIGQDIKARGLPFGRVVSSEFCRCKQTAQHMALGAPIEESKDLTFFVYDEANRCNKTMALLADEPDLGTNTALVSHAGFICPTLDQLAWGEAAIYKPDGNGGSTFITRLLWDQWDTLP